MVKFILSALGVISLNLLSSQFYDSSEPLGEWIINFALRRLPKHLRKRYSEEWMDVLSNTNGGLAKIYFATTTITSALEASRDPAIIADAERFKVASRAVVVALRVTQDLGLTVDEPLEFSEIGEKIVAARNSDYAISEYEHEALRQYRKVVLGMSDEEPPHSEQRQAMGGELEKQRMEGVDCSDAERVYDFYAESSSCATAMAIRKLVEKDNPGFGDEVADVIAYVRKK